MADEPRRGPGRPRKDEARPASDAQPEHIMRPFVALNDQVKHVANEVDERLPDRRPGTVVDLDGPEGHVAADDVRAPAGDLGKAANQMDGRVFITENADPLPMRTARETMPAVASPYGAFQGAPASGGMEVQLLRGYQPGNDDGPQGPKRVPGEVLSLPAKEAKRLINMGAARFPEDAA